MIKEPENHSLIVFVQFFAVLDHLCKTAGLVDSQRIDVRSLFMSELTSIGLRSTERNVIAKFYKKPVGALNITFRPSEASLKKSVQSVYELLCKVVGPVETDKLFGGTIEKVSKSRSAQVYSPKRLL